jgi:histidine ammonia-lyase
MKPIRLTLTGSSLTVDALAHAARTPSEPIHIDRAALKRVRTCEASIQEIVRSYRKSKNSQSGLVYGVTTGFGEFKTIRIELDDLITLQRNILLSHAAGVGESHHEFDSANYFSAEIVRAAILTRLNAFLRGNSGVREVLVLTLQAMLHAGIVPLVPTKGSVGSSGDLCPLAHCFQILLGEGHFYLAHLPPHESRPGLPRRSWTIQGKHVTLYPAAQLWDALHASPLNADLADAIEAVRALPVSYKEGLALTNGATFSAAMLALSSHDAENLANTADLAVAMTMQAVCSRVRFLDEKIHTARGMQGQSDSAANIRALIKGSRLTEWADPVQDAYSIRCAPPVHGASRDAIAYAKNIAQREINASTDNPLFFPGKTPLDAGIRASRPEQRDDLRDALAYSAGNFHGQPVALASDFLTIALAELANIAERRVQMLLDAHHNRFLPPNLTAKPGVNSGFMIAQYSAAALVSENKVLSHPASVDSIPTSANSEDHVAMATHAARKCRVVLENLASVLSIELLVASQALDWRTCLLDPKLNDLAAKDNANYYAIDPNIKSPAEPKPGATSQTVRRRANHRAAEFAKKAQAPSKRTAQSLAPATRSAFLTLRQHVPPLLDDQPLEPMIRTVRQLIASRAFVKPLGSQRPV